MTNFEIEIKLPEGTGQTETESFEMHDTNQILGKFFAIHWRRQLLKQLQYTQSETSFSVLNIDSQQYLSIQLNAHTDKAEPQFNVESNIEFTVVNKELLGLLTRKKNYTIVYKNLNQSQASEQLASFLKGDIDGMIEHYKQLLHKKSLQEYRIS